MDDAQDLERLKELRQILEDAGNTKGPYYWIRPDWAKDMADVLGRQLERLEEDTAGDTTCYGRDYAWAWSYPDRPLDQDDLF